MNIALKLRDQNKAGKERGFALVEMMVALSMLTLLLLPTVPMITNSTNAAQAEYKAQSGIDQGIVMDEVKAAQNAAQRFHEAYPDLPVTKENMQAKGIMPAVGSDLKWDVGQQHGYTDNKQNQVCAFGWSDTRQAKAYTATEPAIYGYNGGDNTLYTEGCSHSDFKRVAVGGSL